MDEHALRLAAATLWAVAIAVGVATESVGLAVAVLVGGGFFFGIAYRVRSYGDLEKPQLTSADRDADGDYGQDDTAEHD